MASKAVEEAVASYYEYAKENGVDDKLIEAFCEVVKLVINRDKDIKYGLKLSQKTKQMIVKMVETKTGGTISDLEAWCKEKNCEAKLLNQYYEMLKIEAPYFFDSYLLYLERKRQEKDKFYAPKREILLKHGLIQALQDLADDKLDILSISMPPGTQKTTLEKFFVTWIIGKYPDDYNLFFSHSSDITRMFYDGVLDITTDSDEYCFNEIFPNVTLESTDAKRGCVNFCKYKPFANLQVTSVGSKNAGKVRCNRLLLCDDLIGGIEEALSPTWLDKLWRIYGVDAKQRKLNGKVKELHIATRWSTRDVIGRLITANEGNDRARFIAIPCVDKNGKSNFLYKYNGMDEKFFRDQASTMDEISFKCLYMNQPVDREGLLYTEDELRRYVSLPNGEPDAIIGVCDTKSKGTDFFVLTCFYKYGEDYYLVDCICDDNSNYEIQYSKTTDLITTHNMQAVEFESNVGGDRIAYEVSERLKKYGHRCNITDKPTETNKETRIIVNAPFIKKHVLFKERDLYGSRDDYGKFMAQLTSYTMVGKNAHDDVPDCLSNFALYVTNTFRRRRAYIGKPLI